MINNRLKLWTTNYIIEDILTKTPYNKNIKLSPTIVINVSSSKAVYDKKKLIPILLALELITGQKGVLTKAKCSLATFRLKKGMEIGVKLTLKKNNMWIFLDKLTQITLPSLVYFNKLKKISYDRCGNLAIGLTDINIFPELDLLREIQHPLIKLNFITGADILIIWNNNYLPSSLLTSNKEAIKCLSSSLQLII